MIQRQEHENNLNKIDKKYIHTINFFIKFYHHDHDLVKHYEMSVSLQSCIQAFAKQDQLLRQITGTLYENLCTQCFITCTQGRMHVLKLLFLFIKFGCIFKLNGYFSNALHPSKYKYATFGKILTAMNCSRLCPVSVWNSSLICTMSISHRVTTILTSVSSSVPKPFIVF